MVNTAVCERDSLKNKLANIPKAAVVFTGDTCGTCPPYLKEIRANTPADTTLIEIPDTTNDCYDLQNRHRIKVTPTTLIFKNGVQVDRFSPTSQNQAVNVKRFLKGLKKTKGARARKRSKA